MLMVSSNQCCDPCDFQKEISLDYCPTQNTPDSRPKLQNEQKEQEYKQQTTTAMSSYDRFLGLIQSFRVRKKETAKQGEPVFCPMKESTFKCSSCEHCELQKTTPMRKPHIM